jgi:uncharacterized protein (TIGR03118 family)
MTTQHSKRSHVLLILAGALTLAPAAPAEQGYVQHNLVSDVSDVEPPPDRTDPNLVNPWGIVHSAMSPWWINSNGKGLSLVYNGAGEPFPPPPADPLVVTIPPPGATGMSKPTGIVFNGTADFEVAAGLPARFIFATEDGTISGWNPMADPTHAIQKANPPDALYKGLTNGKMGDQNVLYAANFRNGTVDVFDKNFNLVSMPPGTFMDANVPQDFAPFNVVNIGGVVFVTFAMQDADREDDVPGPGLGYVDAFTQDGTLLMRLEHGPWMNGPWAVVMAPHGFGKVSGRLLVGNFGSGQIASFDPESGEFEGLLRGQQGKPITIEGLWGLGFGNGFNAGSPTTLFFAAGIEDEDHGLFGTLTSVKNEDEDDQGEDGNHEMEHEHNGDR